VVVQMELRTDQALSDKGHNQAYATQVKSGLSQHGFTGQERFSDPLCNLQRPPVMGVSPVCESNQKTSIGDSLHFREKPLRAERSVGPSMAPARRKNRFWGDFRALSSSIRMMAPRDIPARWAAPSSHSARSCGSRTVNVSLICLDCNTRLEVVVPFYRWLNPPSTATICPVIKLLAPKK
jgi:hypothetical protein